jgi:hypothetical protein
VKSPVVFVVCMVCVWCVHSAALTWCLQQSQSKESNDAPIGKLRATLKQAEGEVCDITKQGGFQGHEPLTLRPLRECIHAVYGDPSMLCTSFGLPQDAEWATHVDDLSARILCLYTLKKNGSAKCAGAVVSSCSVTGGEIGTGPSARWDLSSRFKVRDAL